MPGCRLTKCRRDGAPAQTEPGQEFIGVADEIPIGEEQELDQVIGRPAWALVFQVRTNWDCRDVYVSHIDISRIDCY
jgi:hypothetical protein